MLQVDEVGGLAVAFNPVDQRQLEAELRKLDPRLFLDFEVSPRGPHGPFVYPVVKEWIGDQHPPVPVLVWKTEDGPKPLTLAIVEQVKRQERRDDKLVERVHAANDAHGQELDEDRDEQWDDTIREHERAARNFGHFSGPVPRSRALYLSRARRRASGAS